MLHRFMAQLDMEGISYVRLENSVQLMLCSGLHKWKCAVTAEESGFLCIYSRYPWGVPEERNVELLRTLNSLNAEAAEGCFMLSEGQVILRCSVCVMDPLLFADTVKRQFSSAAALTEWAWNRIFSVLNSPED